MSKQRSSIVIIAASLMTGYLVGCERNEPESTASSVDSAHEAKIPTDSRTTRALELLFALFNDYRLTGGWSRAEPTLIALGGRKVDQKDLVLLGLNQGDGFGFRIVREGQTACLVGVNTKTNSVGVVMSGASATSHDLVRLVGKRIALERLGEESDIDQHSEVFAGWLGADPLGLVVITTSPGVDSEPNFASVGIADWRSAVETSPELKAVFLQRK